jgi:hypothetical protein
LQRGVAMVRDRTDGLEARQDTTDRAGGDDVFEPYSRADRDRVRTTSSPEAFSKCWPSIASAESDCRGGSARRRARLLVTRTHAP